VIARVRRLICLLACAPAAAFAQRAAQARPSPLRAAYRVDAIVDRDVSVQAAFGAAIVSSYNTRVGLDLGLGGVARHGSVRAAGRADLLSRWLSDPFGQSRWGLNAGGGVGVRAEQGAAPRFVALVVLGLEGRSGGRWVPGGELGFGGGIRIGVTAKRAPRNRR
jgi:hypothetical protein